MLAFIKNAAPTLTVKEVTVAMSRLNDVVKPMEIGGATVDDILTGAALLLIERGQLGALEIAQELLHAPEEVEYRTLLRVRKSMQTAHKGGTYGEKSS